MFFVTDFLQVSILPLSDTTLPDHDTIHGLETDMSSVLVTNYPQHFRSFAATLDGRLLVAGGRFVVCVHMCVNIHVLFCSILALQWPALKIYSNMCCSIRIKLLIRAE